MNIINKYNFRRVTLSVFLILFSCKSFAQWQYVGQRGFTDSISGYNQIKINNGTPYVAYRDRSVGNRSTVKYFNGSTWQNLGNIGFSTGAVDYVNFHFADSIPHITFRDGGLSNKGVAMKYDGTNWVHLGTPGFTPGGSNYQNIENIGDTIFVAFRDNANSGGISVMKYDGSTWSFVGTPNFSSGAVLTLDLAVNNNELYVAYIDVGNGNGLTVKKYNGANWVNVGAPSFSPGAANQPNLHFMNSTPYVNFNDVTIGTKMVTYKFNGSNWTIVGSPYSLGLSGNNSLNSIDSTLYSCYTDDSLGLKIVVKKFDGANWIPVGPLGISDSTCGYSRLDIYNNELYIGFQEVLNGKKMSVMKFSSPCTQPSTATIIASSSSICRGDSVSLSVSSSDTLGSAANWHWYESNACGTNPIGIGNSILVFPDSTKTYSVRGEGNCVTLNTCSSITITVNNPPNPYFEFNDFCFGSSNSPSNIVTAGGTFSLTPNPFDGTTINSSTGVISGYTEGSAYAIKYTINGSCPTTYTTTTTVSRIPITNLGSDISANYGDTLILSNQPSISQFKILASDGAPDDQFGIYSDIEGNIAVVGARFDDDNGNNSGAAYVYEFDGTTWNEVQKLTASDGSAGAHFGNSVAINGRRILVGARFANGRGAAYVYSFNGTNWVENQKIVTNDTGSVSAFGNGIDLDGNNMVIGAYGNNSQTGAAYFFKYNGSNWVEINKVIASDGATGDLFGGQVSISKNTAIISCRLHDDNGAGSGAAYIYDFNDTSSIEKQKLLASDGASGDNFSKDVQISGDNLIIGANGDDDNGSGSGSAYIFSYNGTSWIESQKLTASNGATGDDYGRDVSINNDLVMVGSSLNDQSASDAGSAYFYQYNGSSWVEEKIIHAYDGNASEKFAYIVSLGANNAILSSSFDNDNGTNSGSAYIDELTTYYLWSTSQTSDSLILIVNKDTTIGLQTSNLLGCSSNDVINITSICNTPTVPVPNATNTTICIGDSVVLSVAATDSLNSAQNWYWYINNSGLTLIDSGTTISVFPNDTMQYYVRGEGNCIDSSGGYGTFNVNVQTPSSASAGADFTTCESAITINGNISNATGAIWSTTGDGNFVNNTTLSTDYLLGNNDINGGSVSLIITTTGTGSCSPQSDTMNITVLPTPIAIADTNITTCNMTVSLSGAYFNATGCLWSTLGDGTFTTTSDTATTYTLGINDSINGFVNIIFETTGNGICSPGYDTTLIALIASTTVNAGVDQSLCKNESSTINLSGTTSTSTGAWTSTGTGTFAASDSTITTYTPSDSDITTGNITLSLTSTNNGNCPQTTDSVNITFLDLPTVDAGIDTSIYEGESYQMNASSDATTVSWSPSTALDDASILNPLATPLATTSFILAGTTNDGCINTDTVVITVLENIIPDLEIRNLITPNGDGKNDYWTMNDPSQIDGCSITIINRWGSVVYNSIGYDNSWDGTYNGSILPDGTYYYMINCNGNEIKGSITILKVNH